MKPRRSASGVATITVITKPWPCSGACIFCPNDIRCPKSYLHDEPACARAEQNCFDPYLQVSARLTALSQMGHATDKIELIVLGGTWSDYPLDYQVWFMRELFRALNDDAVADVAANPALRGFAEDAGARPQRCCESQGIATSSGARPSACEIGERPRRRTETNADADASIPPGVRERRARYRALGLLPDSWSSGRRAALDAAQRALEARELTYNEAFARVYAHDDAWVRAAAWQRATFAELEAEQRLNEGARHRVVGLVIETRPDAITPGRLLQIRRMGATKIQMGVQSTDQRILDANRRRTETTQIAHAFDLLRLFGFKIHAHAMVNLLGATPEADKLDYERLVSDRSYQPDEVKLYPCALIEGAALNEQYASGAWRPYTEEELVDVLCADVRATPAFCRVSRMIRDFSSGDIKAGNKKPNLRQLVEERLRADGASGASESRLEGEVLATGADTNRLGEGAPLLAGPGEARGVAGVQEIRFREVATDRVDLAQLSLDVVPYETASTRERFLQWVTPEGRIAGFLRLSLPRPGAIEVLAREMDRREAQPATCPIAPGDAMIREVHVYGMAERVGEEGSAAQHHGLGRRLVECACAIAAAEGYERINVISAVGTRAYYRRLGFVDHGLYQQRSLAAGPSGATGTEADDEQA